MLKLNHSPLMTVLIAAGFAASVQAAPEAKAPVNPLADVIEIEGHEKMNEALAGLTKADQDKVRAAVKSQDLQSVFNEKSLQHSLSRHYEKGLTCISCHDQKKVKGRDWMQTVTAPEMKKVCQDCHVTQAQVVATTDTHSNVDCVACHMPNIPAAGAAHANNPLASGLAAVRRSHLYKINTDVKAKTFTGDEKAPYAVGDKGYGYNDIMWSCGGASVANYQVCEGKGCHAPTTSKLDPGMIYKSEAEVKDEIAKWQKPVKETYARVRDSLTRMGRLLEVTELTAAEKTEYYMNVHKARDIVRLIEKDGSWGVHAARYLADQAQIAEHYCNKAQGILDAAYARMKKAK